MTTNTGIATGRLEDLAGPVLASGMSMRFTARGRSMFPFIRNGDRVVVEQCSRDSVRERDIVLARAGNRMVLHRVVSRSAAGVTLLGDAQSRACAEIIPLSGIVGRVVGVERRSGTVCPGSMQMRLLDLAWILLGPLAIFLLRRRASSVRG